MTKKDLIEALSSYDDNAIITVSIDDGTGLQCNAEIKSVRRLLDDHVTLIPNYEN